MIPPAVQSFVRHAAQSVFRGEMDYFDAEYHIASLIPGLGYTDHDAAFDLMAKFISRYEQESLRLSRAIRAVVRPMMDRRQPTDDIKKAAASINKNEFLNPQEIQDILRSEYLAWKSTAPSQQTGKTIMPAHRTPIPRQSPSNQARA